MEKLESYLEYCKNFTIHQLNEYADTNEDIYTHELAYTLCEGINVDGAATLFTYQAKLYLKKWWDEAGECYKYEKDNYGEVLHNPFEAPEAFHACMIIHGVENILSQCPTVQELWDEELVLTDEIIDKVIAEIEEVSEINL